MEKVIGEDGRNTNRKVILGDGCEWVVKRKDLRYIDLGREGKENYHDSQLLKTRQW